RWVGAGRVAAHGAQIQHSDLEMLNGCQLGIRHEAKTGRYVAEMLPESRCCFQYQGQERQVILGFAVDASHLLTYDRGVDPISGAALWGAIAGPYRFQKIQDFASECPP
ncbi:MAG: chorismate mutase, partial [Oscillatoriales cyanobacterium SM2_2_1]|nr:chorismate mutase [Oscillatoriales cyanobacterium SM2_2_1]